jgi:hypothetical protein
MYILFFLFILYYNECARGPHLKVDGNEKEGGREGHHNSGSIWHCGDRGLF